MCVYKNIYIYIYIYIYVYICVICIRKPETLQSFATLQPYNPKPKKPPSRDGGPQPPTGSSRLKNNYFAEMCSGSEEGSYSRLRREDFCFTQL